MTNLRFTGDWSFWLGLTAAVSLGALTWLLYRREMRRRGDRYRWILPALRTAAVVLLVLMLTGPVLSHRRVVGQFARILVFLDNSASMNLTDASMETGRKLALAVELGFLGEDRLPQDLLAARRELATATRAARSGSRKYEPEMPVQVRDALARALGHLEKTRLDTEVLAPARTGTINYQFWTNVNISKLEEIFHIKGFPDSPAGTVQVNRFQGRVDWNDNYVSRMVGYIYPPLTGPYTFWVTADDMGWLYLSTDESDANKILIAYTDSWTPLDQWEQKPSQKSKPVTLRAGHRYYIEALHVEHSGNDHIAAGWQLPNSTMERPIVGNRLSPYPDSNHGAIYAGSRDRLVERFRDELLRPAEKLANERAGDSRYAAAEEGSAEKGSVLGSRKDRGNQESEIRGLTPLGELAVAAEPWEQMLDGAFERWAQGLAQSGVDEVRKAIERVDALSRRERIAALLLGGEEPVLRRLAAQHNVEVIDFGSQEIEPLWHSRPGVEDATVPLPTDLGTSEPAQATNLSLGLQTAIGMRRETPQPRDAGTPADRLAAVILSDGRHNFGAAPLNQAKICGSSGIPVYTVGFGALRGGPDLAVIAVEAPESVFFKDRIKGRVTIKDDIPPGKTFTVRIEGYGRTLWEKELTSTGSGRRLIEFDFGVEDLVKEQLAGQDRQLEFQSHPLQLQASVHGLEQIDVEPANDRSAFRCQAVLRRHRVLILDGGPRWEFRYVRNLFGRDDKWEVSAISADPTAGDGRIKRADTPGCFPATREYLLSHDLIILGDFPPSLLQDQEMQWMREAVRRQGCGIIFIDGLRQHLQQYAQTPLAELIPVSWTGAQVIRDPLSLRLTELGVLRLTDRGVDTAALTLSSGAKTNIEVWASLLPPHWLAAVEPLPGGEVLVEAHLKDKDTPAIVYRRFGAGKVLYMAFDETWRWRYRVADEYHQRYWNHVGRLIMAPPFAVADRFVSIDCGALAYLPGQPAALRARIRDTEGRPVTEARAVAHLYRNGTKAASLDLKLDEDDGTYRAQSGALPAGEYEVRVEVAGYPAEQMLAVGRFFVEPPQSGELADLTCDAPLLQQIAETSGGRFLWEHELSTLPDELRPLSSGQVVETETSLWQSYLWFAVVVGLLTIEWILRKRAGCSNHSG